MRGGRPGACAAALLVATNQLGNGVLERHALAGELALDGSIRAVSGALAMGEGARELGLRGIAIASDSAREAALVDGYTRLQAFIKVVLPQAVTGIVATAIFCLIFAWNEYAFAALLTSGEAQTAPPFIPTIIGEGGQDWPAVAAGTTIFLIPILVFTILLRKQLLRGITFGAVRK